MLTEDLSRWAAKTAARLLLAFAVTMLLLIVAGAMPTGTTP